MKSLNDLFVDGFLAHTFSPQDAHSFFVLLLRNPNFLQHYRITYSHTQGVWYILRSVPSPSLGAPSQNVSLPLDFSVKLTQGTVVPQRRWSPADEVDIRRHVEEATLQLPVFFVRNGGIGFWLPDILQGRDQDLYNRDFQASFGGRATTHIRINVSSRTLVLVAKGFHRRLLSQWPGYDNWKRQIPTKDETYARNPITLGRFMKHVGTSVNNFITVSILLLPLSPSLIGSRDFLALYGEWQPRS